MENKYATMDTVLPDKITHIRGTIERGSKKEFWLTKPCPPNIDPDDWEQIQQEKWDKIFKEKK